MFNHPDATHALSPILAPSKNQAETSLCLIFALLISQGKSRHRFNVPRHANNDLFRPGDEDDDYKDHTNGEEDYVYDEIADGVPTASLTTAQRSAKSKKSGTLSELL